MYILSKIFSESFYLLYHFVSVKSTSIQLLSSHISLFCIMTAKHVWQTKKGGVIFSLFTAYFTAF